MNPRIHSCIETIINNLEERLNDHDNCLTGDGFKIVEFSYSYFGDLKDDVLKETTMGGSGIFMDACSLCEFCNMGYTSKSFFLERVNKVRGVEFKLSGEVRVASTLYQRCPAFLVGHST